MPCQLDHLTPQPNPALESRTIIRHLPSMATIVIPDALKRRIDTQVEAAGYADTTAYLSDLIEDAAAARQSVLAALEEGEASGLSALSPEDILEDLIRKRLAA